MNELLFSKILYATDLSETAKKAARYALSLAGNYGSQLTTAWSSGTSVSWERGKKDCEKMSSAGIDSPTVNNVTERRL